MDKLILKYLHNKLTKEEREKLDNWLSADIENVRLFKNFVGHWKLSDFDVDLSKHKLFQRIQGSDASNSKQSSFLTTKRYLLRIAVIILIALSISYYFVEINDAPPTVVKYVKTLDKSTTKGQKLTIKLPDGSIVKLNAESKLIYPDTFNSNSREVILTGEAFFDIARNENKPFIIHTDQLDVEVLGTSFNINAYPGKEEISVAVKSGKVSVNDTSHTIGSVLIKDEKLILSQNDGSFRKEKIQDIDLAYGWVNNYLSFNDLQLEEAVGLISRWFNVDFQVEHSAKNNKIVTAKFNNPTLKNVMENLSYAYEFKYEINNKTIMIK